MSEPTKLRVITDYEKLSDEIKEQIKLTYPYGYSQHLITFPNREGNTVKGLRFETEEKIYLIRMTVIQAQAIIEDDDDYDDDGNLKKSIKEDYEDKYLEVDVDLDMDDDMDMADELPDDIAELDEDMDD